MIRDLTDIEGGEGTDEIEVDGVRLVVGDPLLHRGLHVGVVVEVLAHGGVVLEFHAASPEQRFILCHTT